MPPLYVPSVAPIPALVPPPSDADDAPPSHAAGVYPHLKVPPGASYTLYTVEDLIAQPGRKS